MKQTTVKEFMKMIPKYNIGDYVSVGVAVDHLYAEAEVINIFKNRGFYQYTIKITDVLVQDSGFTVGHTHNYGDGVLYPCDRDDSQLSDWI
jgi:hypothetical protein